MESNELTRAVLEFSNKTIESASHWLDNFTYTVGETPLSTWRAPAITIFAYLATVRFLKHVVVPRTGTFKLKGVFFVHNSILSMASSVVLAVMVARLVGNWFDAGAGSMAAFKVWCDPYPVQFWQGRLTALYYINYLFKYYELFDTVLMVLRGKPMPFLHVYHHAATLLLCWNQLHEHSGCQWAPIAINLAVHVVMYYYYAVSSLGVRVWWKRYLTMFQITQFVVDVISCTLASVFVISGHYKWKVFGAWWEENGFCSGTPLGAAVGVGILFSYLLLFIKFYVGTYKSKKAKTQ